jgi:hypothetical protein
MAKFYGNIGFAVTVEKAPGVWADTIVEKFYTGDVIQTIRQAQPNPETVNDDLVLQNSISIVADAYVSGNIFAIRYVSWQGTLWKVTNVQMQSPRLQLRFGGVYNGPKAGPPS